MRVSRSTVLQAAATLAVLGVGLAGFRAGYATFQGRDALLGLATGVAVATLGLAAWRRSGASRVGPLLMLAGVAWFPSDWRLAAEPVATLHDWFRMAFASVISHAVLTYPTGRAGSVGRRVLVAIGYLAALLPSIPGTLAILGLLAGHASWAARTERAHDPDARVPTALAGALFGLVLAATAVVPFVSVEGRAFDLRLALEVAFVSVAAVLAHRLVRRRERSIAVDLVLDLAEARGGSLAFQLGLVLDDPTLQVGFRLPGDRSFVDADGRPLAMPAPGSGRAATTVERDGVAVAVLVHRPRLATDPVLTAALTRAAGLAAANARLQAELRTQVEEVQASRRRLIAAEDMERTSLEQRLRRDPERRIASVVAEIDRITAGSPAIDVPLARAAAQLSGARSELGELADGLHPSILDRMGLAGAITDLAARSPVPVTVRVAPSVRGAPAAEATAYFVASEALANVAKHASATQAAIDLAGMDDGLRLQVTDDGVGGASLAAGSGLRGLRDRVEGVGGTFRLDSVRGQGTHLAVTIPSDGEVLRSVGGDGLLHSFPGAPEPTGVIREQE